MKIYHIFPNQNTKPTNFHLTNYNLMYVLWPPNDGRFVKIEQSSWTKKTQHSCKSIIWNFSGKKYSLKSHCMNHQNVKNIRIEICSIVGWKKWYGWFITIGRELERFSPIEGLFLVISCSSNFVFWIILEWCFYGCFDTWMMSILYMMIISYFFLQTSLNFKPQF